MSDRHADDEWFRFVSLEYADTAKSIWPGYLNLYPSGITNGYDWYQVFGGRQDYVTYFLRGREVTIELSNTKTPQESLIFQLWSANKSSLINYIRQAGYGIHGYVTDSLTGEALEAEISIPGYDKLNSEVFSDPEKNGFFTRYLKEGVYNFIVQKDGYLQKNIFNVEVNDYMQTHLEIQLVPVPEEYEELNVRLSSDPYNSELILSIENPEAQTMLVRIYDLNGRLLFNRSYAIEEGFREIDLINDFGSNMIFIQLAFKNENRFFKVVKIK